jgi:hypothetical protein
MFVDTIHPASGEIVIHVNHRLRTLLLHVYRHQCTNIDFHAVEGIGQQFGV